MICHKCLEKNPERRYVSAQGIAEESRVLRPGRRDFCPPDRHVETLRRWIVRNPLIATLVGVIVVGILVGAILGLIALKHIETETKVAEAHAAHADSSEAETQRRLFRK